MKLKQEYHSPAPSLGHDAPDFDVGRTPWIAPSQFQLREQSRCFHAMWTIMYGARGTTHGHASRSQSKTLLRQPDPDHRLSSVESQQPYFGGISRLHSKYPMTLAANDQARTVNLEH